MAQSSSLHNVGGVPQSLIVKILATAAGAGIYTGVAFIFPTVDIDPDVDLTEEIMGSQGVACIIVNRREAGMVGHALDVSGTYQPLLFSGSLIRTNANGTYVYSIDGFQDQLCVV